MNLDGFTIDQIQRKQREELNAKLWKMANDLRGNMDATEFKNYILGLIFYRFLSENIVDTVKEKLDIDYFESCKDPEEKEMLKFLCIDKLALGYFIEPEYLNQTFVDQIKKGTFSIATLTEAVKSLIKSTEGADSEDDFANLFDDMDLTSAKLGKTVEEKTNLISKIILSVSEIDFKINDSEIDVLGDAYEYLIGQFAASAGKKGGEFYTPAQVSKLLARIAVNGKVNVKSVYDPTCGSGSLLLQVKRLIDRKGGEFGRIYGQELNSTTYNLARMNMLLHGITFNKFEIYNGDTLETPCPDHLEEGKFDVVVANPPFSAKWSASSKFLLDERFSAVGKLAPKSKADFAFIQHMIHVLSDTGSMAVVVPHGVLFRGAAEAEIRKYLVKDKNYLDAVIGLPEKLFFGTGIPTAILVFKKCKTTDDVLFIDASKEFEKGKKQNYLTDEHIEKIYDTYTNRKVIDKYSYVAPMKEIEENDFNLNITRYVDTFEEEEEIDINEVRANIEKLEAEIIETEKKINEYLKELGI